MTCFRERSAHIGHGHESSEACRVRNYDDEEINKSGCTWILLKSLYKDTI